MKLLLAEDEKSLSRALTAILTKNNYTVDPVFDGQEALDYLDEEEYDGVILDIMMPKVDGIEVLKRLRAAGNTVPVLMLTAKSEVDDKVLGLDAGANDYLTKPFDAKELLARIRVMTRSAAVAQTDTKLSFGNVSLDSANFTVTGPTGAVTLGNKEYQMLEMMMQNPKQVIPTERFMERVWGFSSDAEINVVWVNISNLRKKLAGLGANVQIKAARNLGYSLNLKEEA
ncbi:MAG: response regulator transcription factor [Lachnospiraceae bacterium]|nr:response regulator transcription factor [Lachnospiraceae bacterium]